MKPRSKIYVTRQVPQSAFDVLLQECNLCFWNSSEPVPRGELLNNIRGVDAILCMPTDKIDGEVLDRAGPSLKVVGTLSEHSDHIDIIECERRNVKVVTMTSGYSEILADLTVNVVVKAYLPEFQEDENANEKVNKNDSISHILSTKSLGLIGFGRTAIAIGKKMRTKGISNIKYHDFSVKPEEKEIGASFEEFDKILKESDIVCICCKESSGNKGLFNKSTFSKMKKSAILIDATRGHVINYAHLYEALREGQILLAGVDLREHGKIPHKEQLSGLNNCIFVPYQESNRWDKRSKATSTVANKIIDVLTTGNVPAQSG